MRNGAQKLNEDLVGKSHFMSVIAASTLATEDRSYLRKLSQRWLCYSFSSKQRRCGPRPRVATHKKSGRKKGGGDFKTKFNM